MELVEDDSSQLFSLLSTAKKIKKSPGKGSFTSQAKQQLDHMRYYAAT
jgi:hypothetical protein